MKTCNKCKVNKNEIDFSKDKTKVDGLKTVCRLCCSIQKKEKLKSKSWITEITVKTSYCSRCTLTKNSEKFDRNKTSPNGLYHTCKECRKKYTKQFYLIHKEKVKTNVKTYYHNNKVKLRPGRKAYQQRMEKEDILYRLSRRLRNRLYYALKRAHWKKGVKFNDYIGCSLEELKIHLEQQFTIGMTWDNYGDWHIDHIIPLSSAKTEIDMCKLCHFSNLQPMWAKDNLSKSNKAS